MGGRLFNSKRIPNELYQEYKNDIMSKLINRRVAFPQCFHGKIDHGDIDTLLTLPLLDKEWIKTTFNIEDKDISQNSDIISIYYKEFQIDFIHVPKEDFETSLNYFHMGDTGNLIGQIFNNIGYKFGHKGLLFEVKTAQEHQLGEIVVSKNMKSILNFIGLDYVHWLKGFKNTEEMYQWIVTSRYFNKDYYLLKNLNHLNRKRNKVRPVYTQFLVYCENREFANNYVPSDLTDHLMRGLEFFYEEEGWWIDRARPLVEKRLEQRKISANFNGDDVKIITGLDGKEVGVILNVFKDAILSFYNMKWDKVASTFTREEITKKFNNWYKTYARNNQQH